MIAGGEDWFAAGADIKAMAQRTFRALTLPVGALLAAARRVRTPLVAAVSGYALGGGCDWRWPAT